MLPETWKEFRLGDLIEEYRNKSVKQDQFEVLTSSRNGLIPQSEYYGEGRILSRDNVGFHVIPDGFMTFRSRSDDGSFFINMNKLGKTGIVSHFYPVFTFKNGDDKFFLDFLNYKRSELGARSVGSSQKVLSLNALREIQFVLPPLEERLKIGVILSTWDSAIEKAMDLILNAKKQKAGLMQQLLTGKRRIPGYSEKWICVRIGEIAELTAGGTPSTNKPEYWGGDIPWMSSGEINLREINDVEGRITEEGLRNSSAKMLPINTVLIALAGQGTTRAKVAISRIALCTNQSVAAIMPKSQLSPEYLFHNLSDRYEELRSLSLGDGGRGGLNLTVLKGVQLSLPALPEQRAIAAILSDADRQIALYTSEKIALERKKAALIQQLFMGKRRVKLDQKEAA